MSQSISEFLYKGPHSQVLLFSMKNGDYLKPHRATVDVLITVAAGIMKIETENQSDTLKQGDYILLEANTKHAITASGELRFYLIKLAPHE